MRKLNVQSFPRPPLLEKTSRHLRITYQGQTLADTRDGFWVLETHYPPSTSLHVLQTHDRVCATSTIHAAHGRGEEGGKGGGAGPPPPIPGKSPSSMHAAPVTQGEKKMSQADC